MLQTLWRAGSISHQGPSSEENAEGVASPSYPQYDVATKPQPSGLRLLSRSAACHNVQTVQFMPFKS